MRRLLINLDDDLDLWLSKQTNQNETVRKALELYKGDITTDSIQGLRISYTEVAKSINELNSKFDYIIRISQQGSVNDTTVVSTKYWGA